MWTEVEENGQKWPFMDFNQSRFQPPSNQFSGCLGKISECQGKYQSKCIRDFGE
jgi:hypothetical protein